MNQENKNLEEVYKSLYEFMIQEEEYKKTLSKLEYSKKILTEDSNFHINETEEFHKEYLKRIEKLIIEKKQFIEFDSLNTRFEFLNNLFQDYLYAVKNENNNGFIKHDVIIKASAKKGYESHLENMLQYISEKLPINIARTEKNENGINNALLTMTSFDLLSLNKFLRKMSRDLVEFEAKTIFPDLNKRTIAQYNELLNIDNKIDITNGIYVGYFLNEYKLPIGYTLLKDQLINDFFDMYNISNLMYNNKIDVLENMQVYCEKSNIAKNPFTEIENREEIKQQTTNINKSRKPKM